MAVEVDELYSNLNKLLNDICKFLSDESNYQTLSPIARKQVDDLIGRSKKQLQVITKLSDNDDGGAYVDMEIKSEDNFEEDDNIYSSVGESTVVPPPIVAQPPVNPYADLPAKHLNPDNKYGSLIWKCKIILNFEKNRRIYAGIHDDWFLIYYSEKDSKPLQAVHLKDYKAECVTSKPNKNGSQDFKLLCTTGDCKEKSFNFVATTHKDMLQWTTRINRCNEKLNKQTQKPVINSTVISEETKDPEEDEIYHDIENYRPETNITVHKPPDLPVRRLIKAYVPLPPVPKQDTINTSEASLSEKGSSRQSTVSTQSDSSFSQTEEDEEDIYQEFVSPTESGKIEQPVSNNNTPPRVKPPLSVSNNTPPTVRPKLSTKPTIMARKPIHLAMMRK